MLTLSADELLVLTGYRHPAKQLAELHRRAFWRAVRCPTTGRVILTRAHYDAVEAGADRPKREPKLHPARA